MRRPTLRILALVAALALVSLATRPAGAQLLLGGQVVEASVARPFVRLLVRLVRHDVSDAPVPVDSTRTDERGLFQLVAAEPGVYQLEFGPATITVGRGPLDTVTGPGERLRQYAVRLAESVGRPLFEFEVDAPVEQVLGTGAPQYPPCLAARGVTGTVVAQFVVDTTGRVDVATFKVLESTHRDFTRAVRTALRNARFLPAELGGMPVRQLVQQPFHFAIDGAGPVVPPPPPDATPRRGQPDC